MKYAAPLGMLLATVVACSTSTNEPAKATPTLNNQQIINRLTRDIWPAVSLYNSQPTQGSEGAQKFHAIVAPDTGGADGLRDAVQSLGQQRQYDAQTQTTHSNDGLTVAHADVQASQGNTATLDVCYTYTHFWYVNVQDMQHAPGASQATVQLVNVNNIWYLNDITNDHVVPSCPASNA
jgi:hypothetical protein